MSITQRNATRNQSTADYQFLKMFIFENRFESGLYKQAAAGAPNSGNLQTGMLVARAAGSQQKATVVFNATALTAGQTVILGGLTYTSTAGTTREQLAAAFANLADGDATGPGTATGAYSGALTGFSTGSVQNGTTVVFTATASGATTALAQTGTGAASTITVVQGVASVAGGLIPVTATNLADTIGIAAMEGDIVALAGGATLQIMHCVKGDVDANLFVLPAGVTLDTPVGNKALRDVLEGLGLHLVNGSIENTKADN
jgi:hypothetical protein